MQTLTRPDVEKVALRSDAMTHTRCDALFKKETVYVDVHRTELAYTSVGIMEHQMPDPDRRWSFGMSRFKCSTMYYSMYTVDSVRGLVQVPNPRLAVYYYSASSLINYITGV